jgi:very-short-patch-repair endonuclease
LFALTFTLTMSKSELEALFETRLRQLAPDLPEPEREARFHPTRKFRFDFLWRGQEDSAGALAGVAAEIDGGQWAPRGGRHNTDKDRFKMAHAAALGFLVLRFSGQMLESDPDQCIELLRRALARLTAKG